MMQNRLIIMKISFTVYKINFFNLPGIKNIEFKRLNVYLSLYTIREIHIKLFFISISKYKHTNIVFRACASANTVLVTALADIVLIRILCFRAGGHTVRSISHMFTFIAVVTPLKIHTNI